MPLLVHKTAPREDIEQWSRDRKKRKDVGRKEGKPSKFSHCCDFYSG